MTTRCRHRFHVMTVLVHLLLWIIMTFTPRATAGEPADNPDKRAASATGGLEVFSDPSGAEVLLDDRAVGVTPLKIESLSVGDYDLVIRKDGYAGYRSRIEVVHSQFTVVSASLSREIYLAWKENQNNAIASSIFFPGKGLVDNGQSRGWLYFFAYLGAGGYGYYNYRSYHNSLRDFDNASALYNAETDPAKINRLYLNIVDAKDRMEKHRDQYDLATKVTAGIWTLNMLDVIIFGGKKPVIYHDSKRRMSLHLGLEYGKIGVIIRYLPFSSRSLTRH